MFFAIKSALPALGILAKILLVAMSTTCKSTTLQADRNNHSLTSNPELVWLLQVWAAMLMVQSLVPSSPWFLSPNKWQNCRMDTRSRLHYEYPVIMGIFLRMYSSYHFVSFRYRYHVKPYLKVHFQKPFYRWHTMAIFSIVTWTCYSSFYLIENHSLYLPSLSLKL